MKWIDQHLGKLLLVLSAACWGVVWCQGAGAGKLGVVADSLRLEYRMDTARYAIDTLATNQAEQGGVIPVAAVKKERKSAVTAIKTGEDRVANLEQQLHVARPRLQVFVELNGAADPTGPLLRGTISARAGAMLRLKEGWDAQVYADDPLLGPVGRRPTLNVGLRKRWRVF